MNEHFLSYKKRITHPIGFRWFLLTKLPSAFFAGLRLQQLTIEESTVTVGYRWFNKNPFRSIYFAVLAMAAEASTGILSMGALYKRNPSVSMLIVRIEGEFYKKAVGKIAFTCSNGLEVQQAVEDAIATGKSIAVKCESVGRNTSNEAVAKFYCTWSFKARSDV